MPYYRNSQAHILLFSGDLPALCDSTSVLSASLPSPSLQTLQSLNCQPQRSAELNQTNLHKGKRHHHHASSPLPSLLLRHSWHLVNKKLCHIRWGAERKQWNKESRLNTECKAFCRDFAAVLQAGCSQWALHWQMTASQPLIIPHCATKAVLSHRQ